MRVFTVSEIALTWWAANSFLRTTARPPICSEYEKQAEVMREYRLGRWADLAPNADLQEECCAEGCNTEEMVEVTNGGPLKIVRNPLYSHSDKTD